VTIQSYDTTHGWLSKVTDNADYSGWIGYPIYNFRASVTSGTIYYKVHYKGGSWSGEFKNWATVYNGKAIDVL